MSNFGEFAFPLARPAILKQEQKRQFLHYLRLEQFQFGQLGTCFVTLPRVEGVVVGLGWSRSRLSPPVRAQAPLKRRPAPTPGGWRKRSRWANTPSCAVAFRQKFLKPRPESFIRVRHQHYQGELHPASRKVDISFQIDSVPLSSPAARHKFALLCGPRLNHATGEVKIACERFPTEQMNEKWCSDVLDKMVKEAEVSRPSFILLMMTDVSVDEPMLTAFCASRTPRTRWPTSRSTPGARPPASRRRAQRDGACRSRTSRKSGSLNHRKTHPVRAWALREEHRRWTHEGMSGRGELQREALRTNLGRRGRAQVRPRKG